MARPVKEGLQYFPFDVDFFNDDKIQLLSSEFQSLGENIVIRLFCKIYANGYFYKCSDDEIALLARSLADGTKPALVKEIIRAAVNRNIFNKQLYESFEILTSNGIQKRFVDAAGRRKAVEICQEFWLRGFQDLPDNFTVTPIDVNIYPGYCNINPGSSVPNDTKTPQSKVKESKRKVNQSKGSGLRPQAPASPPDLDTSPKDGYPQKLFDIFSKQYLQIKGIAYRPSSLKQDLAHLLKAAKYIVEEAEQKQNAKLDTAGALAAFEWFVQQALCISVKEEAWLNRNMAPKYLDTQFNKILLIINSRSNYDTTTNFSSGQPSDKEFFESFKSESTRYS